MNLQQATALIHGAAPLPGDARHPQLWADLGCGDGLFTEALAGLLPAGSTVYGIDTQPTLRQQTLPNGTTLLSMTADFVNDSLQLPLLDGILMANSLHYVYDKPALLQKLRACIKAGAPLIIVEYDTDRPVPRWVPYPISYASLTTLMGAQYDVRKLGERPSAYGRSNMYSAMAMPGAGLGYTGGN